MPTFLCEYCGTKFQAVATLTGAPCYRHPSGPNKGKHKLYEGSEKSQYTCKYCGTLNSSMAGLTSGPCFRHPKGPNKGMHAPSL